MTIESIISNLTDLPPAPKVMPKLLKLLDDMNSSTEDIVNLIEMDASLTAKMIGLSNSAFYGANGSIRDVGEAVNRLGFKEVYRLVTNICAKSFVGGSAEAYGMGADERWYNSVSTGVVMESVAGKLHRFDVSSAYTIGLLHDIGKTVMDQAFASDYETLLRDVEAKGVELRVAEIEQFGFDHAQVGGALLESWNFPLEIYEAIQCQYDPMTAENSPNYAALLHFCRWISASVGGAPGKNAWAFALEPKALDVLGVSSEDAMTYMLAAKEDLDSMEGLLGL